MNNTIGSQLSENNKLYIQSIKDHARLEVEAICRTNDPSSRVAKFVDMIVNTILNEVTTMFEETPTLQQVDVREFISYYMQSVNSLLVGGLLSPLTGDENEWEDTTVPGDVGQEFHIKYRGKDYNIPIESVQVNRRYPKIYRLNGDNNLAHRLDYFQFRDATNPAQIHLTEDSIRFIQFPYTMQTLYARCFVDDRTILDYLDYEPEDITNGLVYPDQSSDDPNAYLIAPKIPFTMLEEAGINVEEEISEFLYIVNDTNTMLENDDIDLDFGDLAYED